MFSLCVGLSTTVVYSQEETSGKGNPLPDSAIFSGTRTVTAADESWARFRKAEKMNDYGGWQWYGRFLDEYAKRTNPDGSLPSAVEYYRLIQDARDPWVSRRAANGWYPVGPLDRPFSFGGLSNYGVGRVNCVAFDPSNDAVWYMGFGQAGIWKTTDTGNTWTEMNNGLPILRISDIAIDPTDSKTIYACLGDFEYCEISLWSEDRKRNTHFGLGIYKTTDGGNSWKPTGLSVALTDFDGSLFRRVFVNPKNNKEVVAAGISGIFKSTDGGDNWTKVYNGVIGDMEMVESNDQKLYAAGRYLEFYGKGEAIVLQSTDFGSTWQTLSTPWPKQSAVTRVELALAPSDSNYVYAACAGGNGGTFYGFYLSTDGGKNWTQKYNHYNNLLSYLPWDSANGNYSQGKYDLALCINPINKKIVYMGGIQTLYSDNEGVDFYHIYSNENHVDEHQFKIHPKLNKWVLCNDGGLYAMDTNPTKTTFDDMFNNNANLSNCEFKAHGINVGSFYRVGISPFDTTAFVAGAQDNGSVVGNSWFYTSGGDGMDCAIYNNEWITSSQYGSFYHFVGGNFDNSMFAGNGRDGTGEWTTPMVPIFSYDQTNQLIQLDDLYLLYDQLVNYANFFDAKSSFVSTRPGTAIDISNAQTGKTYLAKKPNNSLNTPGEVWRCDMQTTTWTDITAGLPDSIYVTDIAIDQTNDSIVYVTFSGFTNGQKVYKTSDAGKTWKNISNNLPNLPVNTVVCDSLDKYHGVYIGTDVGVYYFNDTLNNWQNFSTNLPNVIVSDLDMNPTNHTLVAATFGRSMWAYRLPERPIVKPNRVKLQKLSNIKVMEDNTGHCFIEIPDGLPSMISYDILNQSGQRVMRGNLRNGDNMVDNSTLSSGVYYLRIYTSSQMLVVKKISVSKD